jgi:hypothetical protein
MQFVGCGKSQSDLKDPVRKIQMSIAIRFLFLLLATACSAIIAAAQVNPEQQENQTHHSSSAVTLPRPAATPTPVLISSRKPDGMILSQGNLYFTSHNAAAATVWRTSQSSVPGQERLLYREAGAVFGDIVFAKVDGNFFGYFFAESNQKVITIKRVPLTGGTATVLATLTSIDVDNNRRNLVTDGVNLYWQEVTSVRKMPIRGGRVTVLDPSRDNTPTAGIALQNGNIVYASVEDIRFVPPNGSSVPPESRKIVTAASGVVSLHATSNSVYWGDHDGAVKRKIGTAVTTLQSTGGLASSISSSGSGFSRAEAWTECSGMQCRLHLRFFFARSSMPIGDNALGVTVTAMRKVFWGDAAGVHRKAF